MTQDALDIKNLTVAFFERPVFNNLNFKLPAGQFLAILGPNGAGKSCLIRSILGLLKPSAGEILIHGKTPDKAPCEWIGYVPQVKTLDRSFPGQSMELVLTGLRKKWSWHIGKIAAAHAKEALEQVGAGHLANSSIGKLSGGELQRVFLARCLIRKPKLILLDEPATGVDVTLISDMYRLLDEIRQETGSTIVMVTHDLAAASYHADLVLLVNQEVIYFGIPKDGMTDDYLRRTFGHIGHAHLMGVEQHV